MTWKMVLNIERQFLEQLMATCQIALLLIFSFVTAIEDSTIDWEKYKPKLCIEDEQFSYTNKTTTRVFLGVMFQGIYDIKEDQMEMTMQMTLLEFWFDPSLGLEHARLKAPQLMPKYFSQCIWTPDTIIRNEKASSLYDLTSINRGFKVFPGGYIYRFSRYRVTLDCPMDFRKYPMDTQTCMLIVSPYSSKTTVSIMSWIGEEGTPLFLKERIPTVSITSNVRPLQFTLLYPPILSSYNRTIITGNTSFLECAFHFERHITAGLVNTYIPSFLVVCLSFVSFWIDVKAVPGRVTLGVTALLTLVTQIIHARSRLPEVEYLTAMDVWLFGCLVTVFLSLIEFTLAHSHHQKGTRIYFRSKLATTQIRPASSESKSGIFRLRNNTKMTKSETLEDDKESPNLCLNPENKFDVVSRHVFPLAAGGFTLFYLIYYLQFAENSRTASEYSLRKIYLNNQDL